MRRSTAPLVSALALSLSACASGPSVVHIHSTRPAPVAEPAPAPPPAPRAIEPLEVTLGRPVRGNLVVQTNRPAYVAIFEIVPEQGVTLVRPVSAPQRRFVVSGVSAVPVWWATQAKRPMNAPPSTRFIYAVASDEPLRLPDEAFQPGYLQRRLGLKAYRAAAPYATMRAISREFVAVAADEHWAEDAYAVAPQPTPQPEPLARVHCPGGVVHEVPVELADRTMCPPTRTAMNDGRGRPTRPDSAVDNHGRRVRARGTPGRGPIDRVTEVGGAGNNGRGPQATGNNGHGPQGGWTHEPGGRAVGHPKDSLSGPTRAVGAAMGRGNGAPASKPAAAGPAQNDGGSRVAPRPVRPIGRPTGQSATGARPGPQPQVGAEMKSERPREEPRTDPAADARAKEAKEREAREAREREAREQEAREKEAREKEAREKEAREREEAERKHAEQAKKEEQDRRAKEEQENRAREEQERKAREEQARKDEQERRAKEDKAKEDKAKEERAREEAKPDDKREKESDEKGGTGSRGRPGMEN